ncbi:PAS domain S-box protein [Falsiroseomonas sp. E2-1-a20]|uniref:PAS domain S-box protein n=1 Tax=Falsiroseomonas sp. E2-1-a20 TaxID=3239300 RepID=UPI003F319543
MDAGILVLDASLLVKSWNRWNEGVWGLRPEEVQGLDVFGLDIGLPLERLRAEMLRVLGRDTEHVEQVVTAVDRRGRSLTCRVRISPLRYGSQASQGVVLIIEDVAEARQDQDHARYHGGEHKLGHSIAQLGRIALPDLLVDVAPQAFRAMLAPVLEGTRP